MAVIKSDPGSLNDAVAQLGSDRANYRSSSEGSVTLTAAQFVDGVYVQSGTPGAVNKTTPTAALIVAGIKGCVAGSRFRFVIDNGGDNTLTLVAGTGVTLSGTATVATGKIREFVGVVTVADSGSEAVRVICLPST